MRPEDLIEKRLVALDEISCEGQDLPSVDHPARHEARLGLAGETMAAVIQSSIRGPESIYGEPLVAEVPPARRQGRLTIGKFCRVDFSLVARRRRLRACGADFFWHLSSASHVQSNEDPCSSTFLSIANPTRCDSGVVGAGRWPHSHAANL
jgi:hypothetical protein